MRDRFGESVGEGRKGEREMAGVEGGGKEGERGRSRGRGKGGREGERRGRRGGGEGGREGEEKEGGGKEGGEGRGERKRKRRKREKRQREERRIEGCVLLSLQLQFYITCEGLYGVIISCYGNKIFSILLVTDECRDFVGGNAEFTAIVLFNSSKYSDITIMPTCHQLPVYV